MLEHPPKGMDVSIVRAEKSDRWDTDVIQKLACLKLRMSLANIVRAQARAQLILAVFLSLYKM